MRRIVTVASAVILALTFVAGTTVFAAGQGMGSHSNMGTTTATSTNLGTNSHMGANTTMGTNMGTNSHMVTHPTSTR